VVRFVKGCILNYARKLYYNANKQVSWFSRTKKIIEWEVTTGKAVRFSFKSWKEKCGKGAINFEGKDSYSFISVSFCKQSSVTSVLLPMHECLYTYNVLQYRVLQHTYHSSCKSQIIQAAHSASCNVPRHCCVLTLIGRKQECVILIL
jgi:hypothetical protein